MTAATTPPGSAARPLVIAHGGASWDAPENTIAAFERAVEIGADALALPVQLSRDHHPVVIEDFALEHTTGARGAVSARSVAELKRLDAGGWRGPAFRGQRIQTLAEVLERFRERLGFWIQLRAGRAPEQEIEDRVLSVLEIYDVIDSAVVLASDLGALTRIHGMERGARLAGLIERGPLDVEAARCGGWQALVTPVAVMDRDTADALRPPGLAWVAWRANEPAEIDRALGMGAQGVITARPDLLREGCAPRRGPG